MGQSPETPTHSIVTTSGNYEGVPIMVTAILKAGTPVEFTLTGIAGTVTAIQNDRVLIETSKGETLSPSLADVLVMVKSGALKA